MSSPAAGTDAPQQAPSLALRALARLLQNVGRFARDVVVAPIAARTPREWVGLRLDRGLVEVEAGARLAAWLPAPLPLSTALECLERVEHDPRVRGVFLRVGRAPLGWAKLASFARALERVRERGVRVVVYASHGSNAAAWLGGQADQFWMAPEGRLDLVGVRIESPFVRGALDRLRVRPMVLQAGRYKGIAEILERESMSDDSREALEAVVDDLYGALVTSLVRRAGGEEAARRWIDEGPYLASQARDLGLVDVLVYPDELGQRLRELLHGSPAPGAGRPEADAGAGAREGARVLDARAYLRLARPRFRWRPLAGPARRVVVVPVVGTIGSELARFVCACLSSLRERTDVAAVVLRIDSPGGDPGASDRIWRAVGRLRQRKPVIASMGDTAASGGYYAAMAANAIVAEDTSLTGSIGVVMAGVELESTLSELGVRFDGVQRGRHAGIFSPTGTRSDEERTLLQRQVDLLYETFVTKAAESRGIAPESLEEVAQGRVWSGAAAAQRGLVDLRGGPTEALARARELAGLCDDEGEIAYLSAAPSVWRRWMSSPDEAGARSCLEVRWNPTGPQLWCPIRLTLR